MADDESVRPLFQDQRGAPIGFFLHQSIKNASQRDNLIKYITNNGGKVLDTARGADTVLVDEKHLPFTISVLQADYSSNRDKAFHKIIVEPMRFVQICINYNRFVHPAQKRQGMGGYIGGRTAFSEKDDDNLCWYLSRRIPDPEEGGRLSHGVYKELCNAATINEALAWGKRHPFDSWRERYRKNKLRLDPIIEKYAKKYPPSSSALYNLSRRYNKNPTKVYRFVQPDEDDIIELTGESADELEDTSVYVKPSRSNRVVGPSKRRRIDSSDVSSPVVITPAHKAARLPPSSPIRLHTGSYLRQTGKGRDASGQHHNRRNPFEFSPAFEHFEPEPPGYHQRPRSPVADAPQEDEHLTPAPSPTLVQRRSSAVRSPPHPDRAPPHPSPSIRRVNLANPPSRRPSTSFRDVAHSSPVFAGSGSPRRSGVRSHNTSATEPSSRSVVNLPELAHPITNVANAPAESSITRESSHKQSSPVTQPMRRSSRKLPLRQSSIQILSDEGEDDEHSQETQWAPFKNTRSRSKSVEPASLQRGKRKKNAKGKSLPRNDQQLEPVHEGEVESEQELHAVDHGMASNHVISTVMTETMQEEQNVVDLLVLNAESASGTLSAVSNKTSDKYRDKGSGREDETEDETQGVKRLLDRREEEEGEGKEAEEEAGQAAKGPDGVSSDDEATRQQFLSRAPAARKIASRRHIPPASDDEDDEMHQSFNYPVTVHDTPVRTAKEVLAAFDDSPEAETFAQYKRGKLYSYRSGSPNPRNVQSHGAPRQALPSQKPTQAIPARAHASLGPARTSAGATSSQVLRQLARPRRISFSDSDSSPSSTGSLPQMPLEASVQRTVESRSPQAPSSSRASVARLQLQQGQSRRVSTESTSSELQGKFPTPGTRAYAEKMRMEKELKESPYSPPAGTRAAQVVATAKRTLPPRKPKAGGLM